MAKQPGVMFYFDLRPSLKRLSLEERGRLFEAILDYGELGEVPKLDGNLAFVWDFVHPRLERDAQRYRELSEKKREAALARWEKKNAEDAGASDALQAMPTTTTTTTSTSSSTTTASSTPSERSGWAALLGRRRADRDGRDFNTRRNDALKMMDELMLLR